MSILNRLFPKRFDNAYTGQLPGLWLFVPILIVELVIGGNSMLNARSVAMGADGIPLDSYGPAGAAMVVSLFSLLGLSRLLLSLQGVLVLVRYRAAVPYMYLLFLLLHLGNKALALLYPALKPAGSTPATGSIVVLVMLGALLIGFVLSLAGRRGEKA
jgi:hypothetical protein